MPKRIDKLPKWAQDWLDKNKTAAPNVEYDIWWGCTFIESERDDG
jgi:hypothetical protein